MIDPTIETALWRLTWKLRRRVPGPHRREIRRDLRRDLQTTAAEVGAQEAVRRLGDLDDLAAAYAEAERGRRPGVDVVGGVVAAIVVYLILVLLSGRRLMSVNNLADRGDFDPWRWTLGAPNGKASLITLAGNVEQDFLLTITVHRLAFVLLPALAFVIGARLWRKIDLPRRPGRRDLIPTH